MQIGSYLFFNGNCAEAMEFYKNCIGGEVQAMTIGESPMAAEASPEDQNKVMNASLMKGEQALFMASDNFMDIDEVHHGNSVSIVLDCDSEEQLRDIYSKLVEGGKPGQTPQDVFWGAVYGDLHDKYGFRWMLNYTKPKV